MQFCGARDIMYAVKKHVKTTSILGVAATAVMLSLLAICAVGCSDASVIGSTRSELSLSVGETRDILPYIVFAPSASERTVELASDSDCVEIDGTIIKAVSTGTALITACYRGSSVELAVTVKYGAPFAFDVMSDGYTVQTAEDIESITPVTFSAVFGAQTSELGVEWYVNGEHTADGPVFEFAPADYGRFTVSAEFNGERLDREVSVYRESAATGRYSSLEVTDRRTPLTFAVREQIDTRNPRSIYNWHVNGELSSTAAVFEFMPRAYGEYVVELYVNGAARKFENGDDSVTIVYAPIAPIGSVVFDGFDGVSIDCGCDVRTVSITAPNGSRRVFERADVRHAYLFDGNRFDATEYIDICAEDPMSYTVTLTADTKGEPFVFEQYPMQAERYIENNLFTTNAFITSTADAAEYFEDLYLLGMENGECYLSRDVSESDVRTALVATEKKLGVSIAAELDGNILSVELSGLTNAPTVGGKTNVEQIDTVIPHIVYSRSALRRSDYVLACARLTVDVEVETSEQLLYCIMRGYCPKPVAGSAAHEVYRNACSILRNIIGADHSDVQKVHAIHDWLQWSTRRVYSASSGAAYSFLEGVFGGGALQSAAYTSKGAAKAFALLCGIEGIPCEITVDSGTNGTYYFNKVVIDGLYYNVDVFGGENVTSTPSREIISHSRLLISDAAAVRVGLTPSGGAAYDESLTYHLEKSYASGEYVDSYIDSTELTEEDVFAAVCSGLHDMTSGYGGYMIPGVGTTKTVMRTSYYAEFAVDPRQSAAMINAVADVIKASVEKYLKDNYGIKPESARVNIIVTGNIIQMTVPISQW